MFLKPLIKFVQSSCADLLYQRSLLGEGQVSLTMVTLNSGCPAFYYVQVYGEGFRSLFETIFNPLLLLFLINIMMERNDW